MESTETVRETLDDIEEQTAEKIETGTCYHCGEELPVDELTELSGNDLCESCYNDHMATCDECGCIFDNDDGCCIGDDIICSDCEENTFTCAVCGGRDYDRNHNYVDDESVCEGCMNDSDSIGTCDHCGESHFRENLQYDEDDGVDYCESCYEDRCTRSPICTYHHGPSLQFYGRGKYHMGVELEVDGGDSDDRDESAAQVIEALDDHVYCSNDGSLNTGFEIISHPHTYEELIKVNWADAFQGLLAEGWRGHDTQTAGLHIHIGRGCFDSEDAIARFCTFFENNWAFVKRFSRRKPDSLQRWAARYFTADSELDVKRTAKEIKDISFNSGERYRAVNLCNRSTIEVRVFRSTLKLQTFLATLEFVHLIAEKCNVISDEQAESMPVSEWLEGASENLIRYCASRKIPIQTNESETTQEAA